MALPRNSRRTASIPTTDRPPAPATARWDEPKIILPRRAVIPHHPCWLRGLRWRNGRSDGRAGLICAFALSVGARAICFKPDALTDDGRQVRNVDLPSSDGEVVHDLHRAKLAHYSGGLLLATGGSAMAGSLGGPLELQDEGSFFVNGQLTQSTHPGTAVGGISQPGTITVNQMYVQYRIPKTVSGPAIVMVHGSGHTGATYETTPDGREGWATYFARKGFPVYVVDHSGR